MGGKHTNHREALAGTALFWTLLMTIMMLRLSDKLVCLM